MLPVVITIQCIFGLYNKEHQEVMRCTLEIAI